MSEIQRGSGARPIRVRNLDTGEELLAEAATGPLNTFRECPPTDGTVLRTSVSGTEQGLEDGRPFVRYIVDVAAVRPVGEWRVRRRYREFEALYTRLIDAGAGQVLDLRMPHKTWFFNKSPEVIEERRAKFTLMLNTCLAALHHLSPVARGHLGEFLALNDPQGQAALSAQLSGLNRAAATARAMGAASPTADRVAALREEGGEGGATAVENAAPYAISPPVSPIQPPAGGDDTPARQPVPRTPEAREVEPSPLRASLSGSDEEGGALETDVAAASRGAESRWMQGAPSARGSVGGGGGGGGGSDGAARSRASSRAGELHAVFAVSPRQGRRSRGRPVEGASPRGAFRGTTGRARARAHSRSAASVHLRRALSDTEAQGGALSAEDEDEDEEGKVGGGSFAAAAERAPWSRGRAREGGSSGAESASGGEAASDLHRQQRRRRLQRRVRRQQQQQQLAAATERAEFFQARCDQLTVALSEVQLRGKAAEARAAAAEAEAAAVRARLSAVEREAARWREAAADARDEAACARLGADADASELRERVVAAERAAEEEVETRKAAVEAAVAAAMASAEEECAALAGRLEEEEEEHAAERAEWQWRRQELEQAVSAGTSHRRAAEAAARDAEAARATADRSRRALEAERADHDREVKSLRQERNKARREVARLEEQVAAAKRAAARGNSQAAATPAASPPSPSRTPAPAPPPTTARSQSASDAVGGRDPAAGDGRHRPRSAGHTQPGACAPSNAPAVSTRVEERGSGGGDGAQPDQGAEPSPKATEEEGKEDEREEEEAGETEEAVLPVGGGVAEPLEAADAAGERPNPETGGEEAQPQPREDEGADGPSGGADSPAAVATAGESGSPPGGSPPAATEGAGEEEEGEEATGVGEGSSKVARERDGSDGVCQSEGGSEGEGGPEQGGKAEEEKELERVEEDQEAEEEEEGGEQDGLQQQPEPPQPPPPLTGGASPGHKPAPGSPGRRGGVPAAEKPSPSRQRPSGKAEAAKEADVLAIAPSELHNRMVRFYARKNPSKLARVGGILQTFRGRERVMLETLESRYGADALAGADLAPNDVLQ